jgi:hypothetical protein
MNTELIVVIVVGVLVLLVVRGIRISSKFKTIRADMSYAEVIGIVGTPKSESEFEGVKTCIWRFRVLRGWTINKTITFKDDKVISIQN